VRNNCAVPTSGVKAQRRCEARNSCDCYCMPADDSCGCHCKWQEADWPSSVAPSPDLCCRNCRAPTADDWHHCRVPVARRSTGDYFQNPGEHDRRPSRCPAHSRFGWKHPAARCWSRENLSVSPASWPKADDWQRVGPAGSCWAQTIRQGRDDWNRCPGGLLPREAIPSRKYL
jgi:hypothetical protein